MKKLCIALAIMLVYSHLLLASVRNGYDVHLKEVQESLKALRIILDESDTLSLPQKTDIRNKIASLVDFITYHELTDQLLSQFRLVAPDLYSAVDSLTSKNGKAITVYVRFVQENQMQLGAHGTTNIAQVENEPDLYYSEFGAATVSVKIASVNRSLSLLAHEFGHAFYQVKNLSTYSGFYSRHYQNETFNSSYIGHHSSDPSGAAAHEFENMFKDRLMNFHRTNNLKVEKPLALLIAIKKNMTRALL